MNQLSNLRKNKGLSQQQLAQMLNTTQQTISKYECGASDIPNNILSKMSKIFNVSINQILSENDKSNSISSSVTNDLLYIYDNLSLDDRETWLLLGQRLLKRNK